MQQGLGERLAFWLSTANFAAPFLGVVETGPKCLKTGLSDLDTCIKVAANMRLSSVLLLKVGVMGKMINIVEYFATSRNTKDVVSDLGRILYFSTRKPI